MFSSFALARRLINISDSTSKVPLPLEKINEILFFASISHQTYEKKPMINENFVRGVDGKPVLQSLEDAFGYLQDSPVTDRIINDYFTENLSTVPHSYDDVSAEIHVILRNTLSAYKPFI